ncbi:MAG: hypothetical protein WBP13_10155 [Methylophilaceae bacterium]
MRIFILLITLILGLSACDDTNLMTINQFQSEFKNKCEDALVLKSLPTEEVEKTCQCMVKLAAERWHTVEALNQSLIEEDRAPRGVIDYYEGVARITYRACNLNQLTSEKR